MDMKKLVDYIKWLIANLDDINDAVVDKSDVKTMLLSIIGEMYSSN